MNFKKHYHALPQGCGSLGGKHDSDRSYQHLSPPENTVAPSNLGSCGCVRIRVNPSKKFDGFDSTERIKDAAKLGSFHQTPEINKTWRIWNQHMSHKIQWKNYWNTKYTYHFEEKPNSHQTSLVSGATQQLFLEISALKRLAPFRIWLKLFPNVKLCKPLGKVTPSRLWLKLLPNVKLRKALGKDTLSRLLMAGLKRPLAQSSLLVSYVCHHLPPKAPRVFFW